MFYDADASKIMIVYIFDDGVWPSMKISNTDIEYNTSVDYILFCVSMYIARNARKLILLE